MNKHLLARALRRPTASTTATQDIRFHSAARIALAALFVASVTANAFYALRTAELTKENHRLRATTDSSNPTPESKETLE